MLSRTQRQHRHRTIWVDDGKLRPRQISPTVRGLGGRGYVRRFGIHVRILSAASLPFTDARHFSRSLFTFTQALASDLPQRTRFRRACHNRNGVVTKRGGHHTASTCRVGDPRTQRRASRSTPLGRPATAAPARVAHLLAQPRRLGLAHTTGMASSSRRAIRRHCLAAAQQVARR